MEEAFIRNNLSPELRKRVFDRDEKTCQYCGGFADSIDHIIPVSIGGGERDENLVACCSTCNSLATNYPFKSFKEKKDFILKKRGKSDRKIVFMDGFKFKRICKLPTCGKEYKTNRRWQEFCCPAHQQEWHKLLRKKHEDVVVEIAFLKGQVEKLRSALEFLAGAMLSHCDPRKHSAATATLKQILNDLKKIPKGSNSAAGG